LPLSIEALEDRQLLDAGGLTPPLAPLTPFPSITDFDKHFIDQAVSQYGSLFGTSVPGWVQFLPAYSPVIPNSGPFLPAYSPVVQDSLIYPGYSPGAFGSPSSNPQVPGVGEGDIIQSDGAHLFVLSHNQLIILNRTDSGGLEVDSRLNVPINPVTMFLDGNRLWVVSQVRSPVIYYATPAAASLPLPGDTRTNYLPRLEVTAYDISASGSATLVQDKLFDGTFVAARSVNDHLYLVIQNSDSFLPAPLVVQNGDGTSSYESKDAYIARITPLVPDLVLPHVYQTGPSSDDPASIGLLSQPLDVYQGRLPQDNIETSILTFNMTAAGDAFTDVQTMLNTFPGAVYATSTHIYVASTHYATGSGDTTSSVIQSFAIGGDHVSPEAAGVVQGVVSGQFSLDEFNGDLRVVSTSYTDTAQSLTVSVLRRNGTSLDLVGSAVGLGDGDNLTAVRFAGNTVYLAAAHYTTPTADSLLVVDLTEPTHPALEGQLALAGHVSYLQMLDNSHLFALGYSDNVELTLFDVHNAQTPSVIDHLVVTSQSNQTTSTPAQYNPQPLAFSADGQFLALPIRTSWVAPFSNVVSLDNLYEIDLQHGFHLIGSVGHDSQVERSLLDGSHFFSIADASAKAQEIVTEQTPGSPPTFTLGPSQEVTLVDDPRQFQFPTLKTGNDNTLLGSVVNFTVTDLTGLTATIEWGDGTSSTGNILLSDNHIFSVGGQHTYAGHGQFNITVVFSRNGESAGTVTNSIQVGQIDPQAEYFLRRIYTALLERGIDEAGLENWANLLSQGTSRTFVTQSIMHSTEYYDLQVQNLYSQLLHRAADTSGMATWVPFLAAGHSVDDVRASILSSQEYFAKSGSVAGFVSALYVDLFGRQADPGGQLAWQTVLQLGLPRDQVVALMAHSAEAAVHAVMEDYQRYLGRTAESDGLLYFAGALQSGSNSQDVAAAIMGSQEFLLRTQTDINKYGGF
jgi:hypothetical protein